MTRQSFIWSYKMSDKKEDQKKKIQSLLNQARPDTYTFNMTPEMIQEISKTYLELNKEEESNAEYVKEAMESAEFAQLVLSQVMKGKHIDLSFFKMFAERKTQSINQLENKNKRISVKLKLPNKRDLKKKSG